MPTELKFDDLDLREQPARGDGMTDGPSVQVTCQTAGCNNTKSQACTNNCCTVDC